MFLRGGGVLTLKDTPGLRLVFLHMVLIPFWFWPYYLAVQLQRLLYQKKVAQIRLTKNGALNLEMGKKAKLKLNCLYLIYD